MSVAPAGMAHGIAAAGYEAVVVEVGGGLRSLHHRGRPLIDGYEPDAMCDGARGQLLCPWPNRVEGGAFTHSGRRHQLPVNEVATGCAIHGLTRWVNWQLVEHYSDRVILTHRLHRSPGWDWTLDVTVDYQVASDGLRVSLRVENLDDHVAPIGVGAHPYLVAPSGSLDEWRLTLPADRVARVDDHGIPRETIVVDDNEFDFRRGGLIGGAVLDHPFTDLSRDDDGRAWAHLTDTNGSTVSLWADERHRWFQLYTGDTLSDPLRRRRSLAVEPMTCPPNALATGEDLIELAPSDAVTMCWGIRTD